MSIDEFKVEPCLVVADLIGRAQAYSFTWDGESAVKSDFQVLVGLRRFQEPTHISPASWNRNWWARKCWQSAVSKGFFNGTDVVSVVAPPRSPIEIARNQVHMFAEHHGSNREDERFPDTTFLGADIANMSGQNCKCLLAAKGSSGKRST